MKILAIETSCDETAAAVIEGTDSSFSRSALSNPAAAPSPHAKCGSVRCSDSSRISSKNTSSEDQLKILSNVVVSQVDIFAAYGGVIPEVAARSHLEAILPVVHKAMDDAGLTKEEIDYIAVTHTPGLLGSLLIGTLTARTLAMLWGKPMMAVHHLKSHIYANWLKTDERAKLFSGDAPSSPSLRVSSRSVRSPLVADAPENKLSSLPSFPLLALVVSGGHTQIIYMREHNQFEIVGTTRDDAVGECFDKVAKILGLPYPGGPSIAKAAERGNAKRFCLPRPKVYGLDFSFSGLKTAVLRAVQAELGVPISTPSHELAGKLTEEQKCDFAASFQETACEILVEKMRMAMEKFPGAKAVVLAGGVSANERLRERFCEEFSEAKVDFPEMKFCGDNAAMVGAAAYFEILAGVEAADPYKLNIMPRSAIG